MGYPCQKALPFSKRTRGVTYIEVLLAITLTVLLGSLMVFSDGFVQQNFRDAIPTVTAEKRGEQIRTAVERLQGLSEDIYVTPAWGSGQSWSSWEEIVQAGSRLSAVLSADENLHLSAVTPNSFSEGTYDEAQVQNGYAVWFMRSSALESHPYSPSDGALCLGVLRVLKTGSFIEVRLYTSGQGNLLTVASSSDLEALLLTSYSVPYRAKTDMSLFPYRAENSDLLAPTNYYLRNSVQWVRNNHDTALTTSRNNRVYLVNLPSPSDIDATLQSTKYSPQLFFIEHASPMLVYARLNR